MCTFTFKSQLFKLRVIRNSDVHTFSRVSTGDLCLQQLEIDDILDDTGINTSNVLIISTLKDIQDIVCIYWIVTSVFYYFIGMAIFAIPILIHGTNLRFLFEPTLSILYGIGVFSLFVRLFCGSLPIRFVHDRAGHTIDLFTGAN